jgi:hypothetical protein
VYAARRLSDRTTTTPVAATPASPASPSHFQIGRIAGDPLVLDGHDGTVSDRHDDAAAPVPLDDAMAQSRTGDIWLFRGESAADVMIRTFTNAPVNHVGMAVVFEDLPPLLWHAELGQSLPDVWTGGRHRGVQLHDLRDAVLVWGQRYGQQAWLRQLHGEITAAMEDQVLRTIARLDGTPFPRTAQLAARWALGRMRRPAPLEQTYCAELLATTYAGMGLLSSERPANYYDPGRFWSGDDLELRGGAWLGPEVAIEVPPMYVARPVTG